MTLNKAARYQLTTLPGDKSISHRAIILGSISNATLTFNRFLMSDDCKNTIAIFQQMGVPITVNESQEISDTARNTVTIQGVGLNGLLHPSAPLDVGNSGTGIRLISGVLAGLSSQPHCIAPILITGDHSIQKRPMKRIITPLTTMGAHITGQSTHTSDTTPPLVIYPTKSSLQGITYTLPVASAQVKSCLLLAGLFANSPTTIIEPKRTRNHTEIMFKGFGIDITSTDTDHNNHITLTPPQQLNYQGPSTMTIPADFSSAAFFIILALITGIDLTLHDVNLNPTRAALLDVFKVFGIPVYTVEYIDNDMPKKGIAIRNAGNTMGEPYGDIRINTSGITRKNGAVPPQLIPYIIDEIPILAIYGLFSEGTLRVNNADELRVKESDRIQTIMHMITALDGQITEHSDGFELTGSPQHTPPNNATIDPQFDHRIAMSSIIASYASQTPVTIKDIDCINTSFPTFHTLLEELK